ncbi:MAG: hypothetical protein H6563_02695 [Lewinellaceae bacterium]|nr:hypothetical protein [Lewinellaceae bacterium]
MKAFLIFLSLVFFTLACQTGLKAQGDNQEYVVTEYMKVKPGMEDQYRECEKIWKTIHQERMKAGYITGWELERVVYPYGTANEYDYLTITHYKNWAAIHGENNETWQAMFGKLNDEQRAIAQKAEDYRDMVKREIWTAGDMVFAEGTTPPRYRVENFMRIPADGWNAWIDMETKFVKPVHEKNIAMGNRAGWLIAYMILPQGDGFPYQASTVDYYNTWEDMNKDQGKAWKEVYPNMSDADIGKRIESTRTIILTEVRVLSDYVK